MPKSDNQKLKLFYIADYLMRETDPRNGKHIKDIQGYLEEKGITAEYHSISNDIKLLRDVFGMDVEGGGGRPFYLLSRFFPFEDVSIIAECVGSAKFISEEDAERLIDTLELLCNRYQAERIRKDYFVAERPRQTQKDMLYTLSLIRDAIEEDVKIQFYYTTHRDIRDTSKVEYRRNGERYIVSPFRVVLSEGNHYLIGFDAKYKRIMAYRIDRMEDLSIKEEKRDGEKKYLEYGISDYARQTFGMFLGPKSERIKLLCDYDLLDTMLERFGSSRSVDYRRADKDHFTLETAIVPSSMFYGWVCGLGGKAQIIGPEKVLEGFKQYIRVFKEQYDID